MALLLHLSDLHLGGNGEDMDDHKVALVPLTERIQRETLLRATLKALGRQLANEGRNLDAVAITGDVTVRDDPAGHKALPTLLAELGPVLPPAHAIVVVPGNHDVTWETPPSCPQRYERFLRHARGQGYVTPLLDGIDTPFSGNGADHAVVLDEGRVALIPLNSANYSGVLADVPNLSEAELGSILGSVPDPVGALALASAVRGLRRHDVARLSPNRL